MNRSVIILTLFLLLFSGGCVAPEIATKTAPGPVPTMVPTTPAQVHGTPAATPSLPVTTVPVTVAPTTQKTVNPEKKPTAISEEALNARIVDARNTLNNFIDSDVADTVVIRSNPTQNCEVKKSKELGYLIDITTGESTFIKGDYWQINADLFRQGMKKDREYIIIHTHPRMWTTCGGSGITSLYTFSLGDLEATANLTKQGYHVRKLIAISDKEYVIYPKVKDDWKSRAEIYKGVENIERFIEMKFSYYDPVFNRTFYDVDNIMPLLAKELNYTYIIDRAVLV